MSFGSDRSVLTFHMVLLLDVLHALAVVFDQMLISGGDITNGTLLQENLRKIDIQTFSGNLSFTEDGERRNQLWEFASYTGSQWVAFGVWDSGKVSLNASSITWPGALTRPSDGSCPLQCSNSGICDHVAMTCTCFEGWEGVGCDVLKPKDLLNEGILEFSLHCNVKKSYFKVKVLRVPSILSISASVSSMSSSNIGSPLILSVYSPENDGSSPQTKASMAGSSPEIKYFLLEQGVGDYTVAVENTGVYCPLRAQVKYISDVGGNMCEIVEDRGISATENLLKAWKYDRDNGLYYVCIFVPISFLLFVYTTIRTYRKAKMHTHKKFFRRITIQTHLVNLVQLVVAAMEITQFLSTVFEAESGWDNIGIWKQILNSFGLSTTSQFRWSFWVSICAAVVWLCYVLILYLGLNEKLENTRYGNIFYSTATVVLPLVAGGGYLPILAHSLSAFRCLYSSEGVYLNIEGMCDIQCWKDGEHIAIVVFASLILLTFVNVAISSCYLWQVRNM